MADVLTHVFGEALLANGHPVLIAEATPQDLDRVRSFYEHLSDASTRLRFFGTRRHLPDSELRAVVTSDVNKHVTLLASIGGELIGLGEFVVCPSGDEAEVAFCVADDHHGEGVATLLLERLAMVARHSGIKRFVASTLFENRDMLLVFRTVGLAEQTHVDREAVRVTLDLSTTDQLEARAAERHRLALAAAAAR